jgi:hypothetical protein
MTEDARKLLAGYATNTLTDEEKKALFAAALDDPELFAEIAGEEPLRELLDQPAARTELLNRIEPASAPFRERFAAWLRRPGPLAGLATAATAIAVVSLLPLIRMQPTPTPMIVAKTPTMRPAEVVAPPPEQAQPEPVKSRAASPKPKVPATAHVEMASPPPVAAEVAQMPAAILDYSVLTRDSAGNFVEVKKGTPLADGTVVRLRFRSLEAGRMSVRDSERSLFAGQLAANADVEIGPIEMDRDHTIEVAFDPGFGARLMAFQATPERRKAAVADVIHRDESAANKAAEQSAAAPAQPQFRALPTSVPEPEKSAVRFDIFLHRK